MSWRIVPYEPGRHGIGAWEVVRRVFAEYGWPFDVDGYDADVREPHRHYMPPGGAFWVAEDEGGHVVACVGATDEGRGRFELHRLYVRAEARRGGLGEALVQHVLDFAAERGGREVELFSDVAFLDAHRLYARLGFRNHRFRYAPDPWRSPEWGFVRPLP